MSVRARRWALDGAVRAMTATTTTREGWMWARAMTTATATATTRASATMGEGREWRGGGRRWYANATDADALRRNIGISAHIDSGKTTLTERILFYTGRITRYTRCEGKTVSGRRWTRWSSSERRGSRFSRRRRIVDGRRAILILSIRRDTSITRSVERALRVLDGAVLVLCSVGGVQSQSITVDRQMRRYNVPRLCFVNKCDRAGRILGRCWTRCGKVEAQRRGCADSDRFGGSTPGCGRSRAHAIRRLLRGQRSDAHRG